MTRREFVKVSLGLGAAVAAKSEAKALQQSSPFLRREGFQLLFGGQPFRTLGVNKHELLSLYLADLLGRDRNEAFTSARKSLDALAQTGMVALRVNALPFWPAEIERTYFEARDVFWRRFDEMVSDCRQRGLKLIPVLMWHIAFPDLASENLQDFANHPRSKSRRLFEAWVEDIVTRYRDDPTILFWELTNEANLTVDLKPMFPQGVIPPFDLTKPYKHLVRNPAPRNERNNWSADELASFVRETTFLIKSLDPNHLVGTGFSLPRPSAWHLWLGSLRRAKEMDWTKDSEEEQANFIRLINPEPIDLISFHFYLDADETLDQILVLNRVADELDKPIYAGELGVSTKAVPQGYSHPAGREGLRFVLEMMEALDVPMVLIWSWDDYCKPLHEPTVYSDKHLEVVAMLKKFQERWGKNFRPTTRGVSESTWQRLQTLLQDWRKVLRRAK
jgi:hypothetical protein